MPSLDFRGNHPFFQFFYNSLFLKKKNEPPIIKLKIFKQHYKHDNIKKIMLGFLRLLLLFSSDKSFCEIKGTFLTNLDKIL